MTFAAVSAARQEAAQAVVGVGGGTFFFFFCSRTKASKALITNDMRAAW